jgi:hypothetical protein
MVSYRGDPFWGNTDPLRQEIRDMHQELVKALGFEPKGNHTDSLLLIVAALNVGSSCRKVIHYTGLPWGFVRPRIRRLKKSGIWLDNGKIGMGANLSDDAELATELLLMVLCAEGEAERTGWEG